MTNERPENVWAATLPNGLRVRVLCKPGFQRSYAVFATCYGGADRRFRVNDTWTDTPAGVAHYLEHKLFDMPDGSDALLTLSENGADPNAFTSTNMTAYYFSCTDRFEDNLRTLLRFVSTPYFTDASVAKEQGIIAQEINMIEDNPEWQVYKRLMQALYHTSPARTSVAGSVESIRQITAQTLYDCHKAFYTPANMCLVVVGDVKPERIIASANQILPAKSGPLIRRDYGAEEELTAAEHFVTAAMEVSMPTFLVGFKCPPQHGGEQQHRFTAIGELACDVLMGESSPLYARLYSQGLINGSFGSAFDILPGAAYVYAGGDSKEPKAVAEAIIAEAQRLASEGVDGDYYKRIVNANFGAALRGLNSFESIAVSMAEGHFQSYDPYRFPEIYDSITVEDVLDFLRQNMTRDHMALSVITPKEV